MICSKCGKITNSTNHYCMCDDCARKKELKELIKEAIREMKAEDAENELHYMNGKSVICENCAWINKSYTEYPCKMCKRNAYLIFEYTEQSNDHWKPSKEDS